MPLPSVAQKAALFGLAGLALLALGVAATALATGWAAAIALWGVPVVTGLGVAALRPLPTADLLPEPRPAASPAEARARFAATAARDGAHTLPACRSLLLEPAGAPLRAVVLLHGFSNCPATFRDLAPALCRRGCVVVAPRMPWNGPADNGSPSLGRLTASDLVAWVDDALDIAAGFGVPVHVAGISGGAVAAGWALAVRPGIAGATLIAPAYGLARFGPRQTRFLWGLLATLPQLSLWKDPWRRRRIPMRPHVMKRQMTKGVAAMLRLGLATSARLGSHGCAGAAPMWIVWNEADRAVSAPAARAVAGRFAAAGIAVSWRSIPAAAGLGHELIDPTNPETRPALVTPLLADWLAGDRWPACLGRP